jgi:L-lysine exporter family protein LysE/ArgO
MFEALFHGVILAFGLILPLGVQNVFIFNQGATQPSFGKALPAVLTASISDSLMIIVAVLGISVIVYSFVWLKTLILLIGILFLLYMAWTLWKTEPQPLGYDENTGMSGKKQIIFAASVSLLNPHAILDIVGVIGTSSLNYESNEKLIFTLSTIVVSWIWFFGLAILGRTIRGFQNHGKMISILNKVSALIVLGTAVYLGLQNF